jgi:hypothetical protein
MSLLLALRDLRGAAKVWLLLGAQRTNKVAIILAAAGIWHMW